jgi:adenine/guanine/hypoxanthine permease
MRDNKLPRAKQAMVSDAIGTEAGAVLGTSTVTSFIECCADDRRRDDDAKRDED